MEWWAWALIAAGVLVLGYFKLKIFSKIIKKKQVPSFRDEE